MTGTTIYRSGIQPDWIDYNGHLRDAYYVVVLSLATDALMDAVGLDEAYRKRTECTLFSVEMHLHWKHEVKQDDRLIVDAHILGADAKRIHVGYDVRTEARAEPSATAEFMLLHVRQGANPGVASFPPEVAAAIERLRAASDGEHWAGPRSRAIGLVKR